MSIKSVLTNLLLLFFRVTVRILVVSYVCFQDHGNLHCRFTTFYWCLSICIILSSVLILKSKGQKDMIFGFTFFGNV